MTEGEDLIVRLRDYCQRKSPHSLDALDLLPHSMHGDLAAYVMRGRRPGPFISAVVSNQFYEAVVHGDVQNLQTLVHWARFCYNDLPMSSYGSEQKVDAWIKSGGLLGQQQARQEKYHVPKISK